MGPRPFFPEGAGFLSCTEHRGGAHFAGLQRNGRLRAASIPRLQALLSAAI